jgi:hypothetical protein
MSWTLIQQLYAIERQAREEQMDYDQRKTLRQEKSAPILQELHSLAERKYYPDPAKKRHRNSHCLYTCTCGHG